MIEQKYFQVLATIINKLKAKINLQNIIYFWKTIRVLQNPFATFPFMLSIHFIQE